MIAASSIVLLEIPIRLDNPRKRNGEGREWLASKRGKTEKEGEAGKQQVIRNSIAPYNIARGQRSNQKKPGAMAKRSVQRVYPFETQLFSLRLTSFVLLLSVIFATFSLPTFVVAFLHYYTLLPSDCALRLYALAFPHRAIVHVVCKLLHEPQREFPSRYRDGAYLRTISNGRSLRHRWSSILCDIVT